MLVVCPSLSKGTILPSVSPGMLSEVAEQVNLSQKTSVTAR